MPTKIWLGSLVIAAICGKVAVHISKYLGLGDEWEVLLALGAAVVGFYLASGLVTQEEVLFATSEQYFLRSDLITNTLRSERRGPYGLSFSRRPTLKTVESALARLSKKGLLEGSEVLCPDYGKPNTRHYWYRRLLRPVVSSASTGG